MKDELIPSIKVPGGYIKEVATMQTGGGVQVDYIFLTDGKTIAIGAENVGLINGQEADDLFEDEGQGSYWFSEDHPMPTHMTFDEYYELGVWIRDIQHNVTGGGLVETTITLKNGVILWLDPCSESMGVFLPDRPVDRAVIAYPL